MVDLNPFKTSPDISRARVYGKSVLYHNQTVFSRLGPINTKYQKELVTLLVGLRKKTSEFRCDNEWSYVYVCIQLLKCNSYRGTNLTV